MAMEYFFRLFDAPKNDSQAKELSDVLSSDEGGEGWQLVCVTSLPGPQKAILIGFQRLVD